MTNQSGRTKALRQLAACCCMFFGLSVVIVWASLSHRASVEKGFSRHLRRVNLGSLVLPYDVKLENRLIGPESYSAKARLADGATLGDIKSALAKLSECSPKQDDLGVSCSMGDWGVWVTSVSNSEVEVTITPFSS